MQESNDQVSSSKSNFLGYKLFAIAAAIALVVSGVYFFKNAINKETERFAKQDVTPGTVGATLTLGNGKKNRLTDAANGEIARKSGISVTKMDDGQLVYKIKETNKASNKINTLSTAKGETYILILPDKSKVGVWRLDFPVRCSPS